MGVCQVLHRRSRRFFFCFLRGGSWEEPQKKGFKFLGRNLRETRFQNLCGVLRGRLQNPISSVSSKETGFWIPKEKTTGGLPIYPQTPFNGQRGAIAPLWNHPGCRSFLGKGSSLTARRARAVAYGSLRRLLRARGGEPERGRVKRHPQGVPFSPSRPPFSLGCKTRFFLAEQKEMGFETVLLWFFQEPAPRFF